MTISFILTEKMGKQYSQTTLKSPTMFRKYCVGVGEEGDLSLLRLPDTNFYFNFISSPIGLTIAVSLTPRKV